MTLIPYNQNIPGSQNNPSDDQPLMRANTNSIRDWVQIDHHGFKDNLGGYHTIIHQDTSTRTIDRTIPPSGTNPSGFPGAIPSIMQFFSALTNTPTGNDTQLFSLTGSGGLSQLTGNVSLSDGYQWLGGVLLQWGGVNSITQGDVKFIDGTRPGCINFPNNCFVALATPHSNGIAPAGPAVITTYNLLPDKFSWFFRPSAGNFVGFFWVAIGN